MTQPTQTRCGHVAIIGRPNVGKSTLLNHLLGQKISITSRKPQTTRYRILGIRTIDDDQIVYVDTPGLHGGAKRMLNRMMIQVVKNVIEEVDAILWVVEALKWTEEDEQVFSKLLKANQPVILVVNKVDKVTEKSRLLPFVRQLYARSEELQQISSPGAARRSLPEGEVERELTSPHSESEQKEELASLLEGEVKEDLVSPLSAEGELKDKPFSFAAVFLVSAKNGNNLDELEKKITTLLPIAPHIFAEDQVTDKNFKFLAAEFIREKLFRETGEELPYAMAVEIEKFVLEKEIYHISGLIYVEKDSQKAMVIGKRGEKLKEIGRQARLEIERMLEKKVFLQLWVKVKPNWIEHEKGII